MAAGPISILGSECANSGQTPILLTHKTPGLAASPGSRPSPSQAAPSSPKWSPRFTQPPGVPCRASTHGLIGRAARAPGPEAEVGRDAGEGRGLGARPAGGPARSGLSPRWLVRPKPRLLLGTRKEGARRVPRGAKGHGGRQSPRPKGCGSTEVRRVKQKDSEGCGPGGGLRAEEGRGEQACTDGAGAVARPRSGRQRSRKFCPGPGLSPCPKFLSLCLFSGPRRTRTLVSWVPGLWGGAPGAAGSGRQGPHAHGPASTCLESPCFPHRPQSPFPAPPVPGPRQASVGRRQRLTMRSSGKAPMLQRRPASPAASFSMAWAPSGPPSRGPDGQSRAARAPAAATTSRGRRALLAWRPGRLRESRGRTPGGAPNPAPAPPPGPRPRPSRRQVPPSRPAARPPLPERPGDSRGPRSPGGGLGGMEDARRHLRARGWNQPRLPAERVWTPPGPPGAAPLLACSCAGLPEPPPTPRWVCCASQSSCPESAVASQERRCLQDIYHLQLHAIRRGRLISHILLMSKLRLREVTWQLGPEPGFDCESCCPAWLSPQPIIALSDLASFQDPGALLPIFTSPESQIAPHVHSCVNAPSR